ncbi:inhibitor of Bruton tyrosine kinase-like [Diadema antillarum]|uniref:inhibitor of Bruton tyrosine kinase-like n=1 Tax=Diadema antillarum TaxID=105358 RepID=UPI003A87E9F5
MEPPSPWECTPRCRSQEHGSDMTAVITCGTVHQIKTFVLSHCLNPFHLTDECGRTLLHVAASCGKLEIVEWLQANGADCRVKDKESGWTPLHRSLFFGQISCAIHLMRHGASLKRFDKEDLTPLELVMKDKPAYVSFNKNDPTQAYSWGTNANFNLGHGRQRSREQPELVDTLAVSNYNIKQVVMSKFHTLFLTQQGRVLSCGHGQGGRLGLGDETTCLRPQLVKSVGARCKMVAAARDHSLFLTDSGNVMSCGENSYLQLGHSAIGQKCFLPKSLASKSLKNKEVIGVTAGRFHTVVYTKEAVFTLGLNAGQLGHNRGEKHIQHPRQVTSLSHPNIVIRDVVTSDAATVCLTKEGDIYVLHEYQCRKVASNHLSVRQLAVVGGNLNAELAENVLQKQGGVELQLLAIHTNGKVYSWGKSENTWLHCVWSHRRPVSMQQVAFSQHSMAFITPEGEGFIGRFNTRKGQDDQSSKSIQERSGAKDKVEGRGEQWVSLERLPVIHRAMGVACDPGGKNFVMLQSDPRTSLTELPEVGAAKLESNLAQLMEDTDTTDMIHDALIKLGSHRIAAHSYILAHGSDYFGRLFADTSESDDLKENSGRLSHRPPVIEESGTTIVDLTGIVDYNIFHLLMQYAYTGTCDIFRPGFDAQTVAPKQNNLADYADSRNIDCDHTSDDSYGIEELTINERNRHQSAYTVHKEHKQRVEKVEGNKKGRKGQRKGKGAASEPTRGKKDAGLLGVKAVVEEAKKFGMRSLAKRLENVKCSDGTLVNFGPKASPLCFERSAFPHLCDVVLRSEEGALFPCHKCILVARLDYFQSMLGCGWMEASTKEPLQMTMPALVLKIVLDYLYMDQAPSLVQCQDLELLCNTLTIADQLFITRLKDICELALADLITLRNVSDLLQFASVYQAPQLRATCHQFISLNLAALLEAGSLDALEDDVLEDLSAAYKETLPYSRFIRPSMSAPDISHIDPYPPEEDSAPLDQDGSAEPRSPVTSISDFEALARKAKAKRKGRRRTSSTGKAVSAGISESAEDAVSVTISSEVSGPASLSRSNSGCYDSQPVSTSQSSLQQDAVASSPVAAAMHPVSANPAGNAEMDAATDWSRDDAVVVVGKKKKKRKQQVDQAWKDDSDEKGDERHGHLSPITVHVQANHHEQLEEVNHTSGTTAASWTSWGSPKSPVTGLRDIMESQSSTKHGVTSHQTTAVATGTNRGSATTTTTAAPATNAGQPATTPTRSLGPSPALSPTQRQMSRGPTPTSGKKSQKQRKRELQAAMSAGAGDKSPGGQTAGERSPVVCPWASVSSPAPAQVLSFRDVQAQEERMGVMATASSASSLQDRKSFSAARKISFGLATPSSHSLVEVEKAPPAASPTSPSSPKEIINPWQRTGAASPPAPSISFSEIVKAESEQENYLDKAKSKSLAQIQIEERAIEELLAHYRGVGKPDEYITVERVQNVMATPLWKKKTEGR